MTIVTKETEGALTELIAQCFRENRVLDRLVSVLGVKFACNKAASKIHQGIAHYFPALSDQIGELCLERYNLSVQYGATPEATEDYQSVTEMIELLERRVVEFQTMFMGVCKIALDNNDLHVYADLMELLRGYNKMVEQAILLADKIHFYGENGIMSFDHDINHFWILGEGA